jgi:hypothetical protein
MEAVARTHRIKVVDLGGWISLVYMNAKAEFPELRLSKPALICLAVATLRMMDLDILASNSKLQSEKTQQRDKFLKSFADYDLPKRVTTMPNGLEGDLRDLLNQQCAKVDTKPNKIAILTELCFVNPWDGMRLIATKNVDDGVRRLALKEVAMNFELPLANKSVDTALDVDLGGAKSALRDWQTIGKAAVLVGAGASVGALFLAPHIGAAIGGAMGLSGAAATSAGLAFVGGGSLAAGGLGMAGGTIIIGATSGLVAGTTGGIASGLAGINTDASIESQKLYVMLQMLNRAYETQLVLDISAHLNRHAENLQSKRLIEEKKDKEIRNKELIKNLAKEEKMLRAVISKN